VPGQRNIAALTAGLLLTAATCLAAAAPAQAATSPPSPPRPAAHPAGTIHAGVEKAGVEKAGVTPLSDSGCDGTLPWDNVVDCIWIDGSEDFVQDIHGQAHAKNQEVYDATLYIVNPSGYYVAKYGPVNIPVPDTAYLQWTPKAIEQTGAWCSELWAGDQEIISECQPVS
jgi:hypothetical protein